MEDKNENNDLHRNFIFNNESAIKQIRWLDFLTDCEAIGGDCAEVAQMEKQELTKAEKWLQKTHQDIMQNFDPDVIKLRKKRKIVIAPGAYYGVLGSDGE